MQSRFHPMFYVILPLAVLGFATQFETLVRSLVVPIAIIAVLFVLYFVMQKRPIRHRNARPAPRQTRRQPEKLKPKRQASPFRVIEGRKNRDDEEPPRYH
ncbi:hypothetical protein GE107_12050 [Cohnella sp. CFH 77786]|uniref:hypothetical protein n=1 Tax=Cohnella sp. CFH 77786 TaxID=2662265 RepID=UPI001C60A63A|nr:hypothetical protein [Cohnella sp. CFH 77786]MBW5446795.1 hypothetical protein [Cohnella sp. CFH 77786]